MVGEGLRGPVAGLEADVVQGLQRCGELGAEPGGYNLAVSSMTLAQPLCLKFRQEAGGDRDVASTTGVGRR